MVDAERGGLIIGRKHTMNGYHMCSRFTLFAVFLIINVVSYPLVQAAEPTRVIVKNTHLIDRQGVEEDVVVSLVITNKQLEVVTQDDISPDAADMVVDAGNGFLLGSLEIGTSPSFVILDTAICRRRLALEQARRRHQALFRRCRLVVRETICSQTHSQGHAVPGTWVNRQSVR